MRLQRILPGWIPAALLLAMSVALDACTGDKATTPSEPGLTVTTSASWLSLTAGDSATLVVRIKRNGLAGGVTLAVSGLPPHVVADIEPNPATGPGAVVSLNVGDSATPGFYRLSLNASSPGMSRQTIPLDLAVVPRSAYAVTVAYLRHHRAGGPAAVTVPSCPTCDPIAQR